jgi:two-component system, cell cycle sensor histidine kinase and response regulator CckA
MAFCTEGPAARSLDSSGATLHDPRQFAKAVGAEEAWLEGLDRVSRLACEILDVPVAQVNVVLPDVQSSISSVGRGPEQASWNGPREVPIQTSYCRHVARSGRPLAVEDARTHPLVKDSPATISGGIRAYLGVPLKDEDGNTLATLCVVDFEPRSWDRRSLAALGSLADFLVGEIRSRIEAETELRRSEARFRALIEQGDDLITVLDPEWRIVFQSSAYERVLGYPEGRLLGTSFPELIHPDDVSRWSDGFIRFLQKPGGRSSGEWRMRHHDGSWRSVDAKGANLCDDPAVGGIVLNLLDISSRKRVERELQQSQKMEAVGRLAGGVAHDFNNLLTAIKGNTSFMLSRGDLSPEAEEDAREMLDAVERAHGLARQLLSFSRDQVLDVEVVDLGAVVEEMTPLIQRLLGTQVELRGEFQKGIHTLADKGQIGQIVMNLAINARDAMSSGGTLSLKTRKVEVGQQQAGSHGAIEPGPYAQLTVTDTGSGMKRSVQERIFDPFFTTKGDGHGTGLGLSIVWGVLRQMGGHIHLYSEPERGTVFRLYFPWAGEEAVSQVDHGSEAAVAPVAVSMRPGTILVVEDQPEVRRVMARALSSEGHRVLEAGSGEDALEVATGLEGAPDLLLTDILLPGLKGTGVAWKLTARWPDLHVLFTSGFTRGELLEQKVELRNAGFLPKPFSPQELLEAVGRALSDSPAV